MICREICKLLLFTFLHFTLLPFQANCSSPQMEMERLCKLQLSPLEVSVPRKRGNRRGCKDH